MRLIRFRNSSTLKRILVFAIWLVGATSLGALVYLIWPGDPKHMEPSSREQSFVIYTTRYCGFCMRAKRELDARGLSYKEIDVTDDPQTRLAASERYNWPTVPMIVYRDRFVGGSSELLEALATNTLP